MTTSWALLEFVFLSELLDGVAAPPEMLFLSTLGACDRETLLAVPIAVVDVTRCDKDTAVRIMAVESLLSGEFEEVCLDLVYKPGWEQRFC